GSGVGARRRAPVGTGRRRVSSGYRAPAGVEWVPGAGGWRVGTGPPAGVEWVPGPRWVPGAGGSGARRRPPRCTPVGRATPARLGALTGVWVRAVGGRP